MRKIPFIVAGIMATVMGAAYATGENIVASKSYVDTKQVKLHTANANPANNGTTVVTYTDTEGATGERGIFDSSTGWDSNNGEIVSGHEGDLVTASYLVDVANAFTQQVGTAGTVVVRDGGGAPFEERAIYDGSTQYSAATDSDSLITAGAVANALPTGTADTVVTYNNNGKIGGERGIYSGGNYDVSTDADKLVTASALENLPSMETTKLVCANPNDGCTLWTMQTKYAVQKYECVQDSDCAGTELQCPAISEVRCSDTHQCFCAYR